MQQMAPLIISFWNIFWGVISPNPYLTGRFHWNIYIELELNYINNKILYDTYIHIYIDIPQTQNIFSNIFKRSYATFLQYWNVGSKEYLKNYLKYYAKLS